MKFADFSEKSCAKLSPKQIMTSDPVRLGAFLLIKQ